MYNGALNIIIHFIMNADYVKPSRIFWGFQLPALISKLDYWCVIYRIIGFQAAAVGCGSEF